MGIYIHVPFCRSKCYYCGFYSLASLVSEEAYIQALCREMSLRKDYLSFEKVETFYLGGGTPSYLPVRDLEKIVGEAERNYVILPDAERTIEMNPEDAGPEKLKDLRRLGFNRLSIGVQTFHETALKKIHRTHTALQAERAVENAAAAGFGNIGVDLMLGLPGCGYKELEADLKKVVHLPVSHVSVYMLSIDTGSIFEKQWKKGNFQPVADDVLADYYRIVCEFLKGNDFEHYEISNFAREGKYSVHNTNYWKQKPYIGFGPAAHSYDLNSRQWNISHLKYYIDSLNNNCLNFEREQLSGVDKYNEYIMTRLRTIWGADLTTLRNDYASYWKLQEKKIGGYIRQEKAEINGDSLRLTEKGWLLSDAIFGDLFVV